MYTFFRAALLSFGGIAALAQAEETLPKAVSYLLQETTPFSARSLEQQYDANDIAAWMLEANLVAKEYVDGLDRGHYAQSWLKGDPLFQKTITQQQWVMALEQKRKPFGKARSRTLRDQRFAWDSPNLPKGSYMSVEFDTQFERGPALVEILTLRRGEEGKWRVLTYRIY